MQFELDVEEAGFHAADAVAPEPGQGELVEEEFGFSLWELLREVGDDVGHLALVLRAECFVGSI